MLEQGRPNFFPLGVLELKRNGLPNRPKANESSLRAGPHDFILSGTVLKVKKIASKRKHCLQSVKYQTGLTGVNVSNLV